MAHVARLATKDWRLVVRSMSRKSVLTGDICCRYIGPNVPAYVNDFIVTKVEVSGATSKHVGEVSKATLALAKGLRPYVFENLRFDFWGNARVAEFS